MENSLSNSEFPNFGKNLSFIMDHDSGYMSSESNARLDEEKYVISEVIPNAGNNTEDAVDGNSDLKHWEVIATSFMNIVNKDDPIINVENSEPSQPSKLLQMRSLTPKKTYENPINPNVSPDLFADEEVEQAYDNTEKVVTTAAQNIVEKKYIVKKDYSLVKRASNSIKGVIPPHSMTVTLLTVDEILNKIESNKDYFWNCDTAMQSENVQVLNTSNESTDDSFKSLLLTGTVEIIEKKWPNILEGRFHGLQ